ncbi:pyridoxamine 5'-phosphate oxidase family protein [Dialister hominis]|uniref:pyridoxamine 5'-phosphate oxidase family protein n=1 Tax=Dialister hominis TaxID=2582419 RepID=UPI00402518C7
MKVYPMRRKDRQAGEEDILRILKENVYGVLSTISEDGWPYGVLSTISEDGWPYGVPVSYVYEDGKIYFHSATMGHKVDNLAHSEKASFCVVGKTELLPEQFSTRYESVIAFGSVTKLEGQDKIDGLMKLGDALSEGYQELGLKKAEAGVNHYNSYCLTIEEVTGKIRK